MSTDLEKAVAAARELRAAVVEGHQMLKDLKAERMAAREARKELSMLYEAMIQGHLHGIREILDESVKREIDALGVVTEKAMRDSVKKVEAEFDKLAAILLGKEGDGNSIEQLFEAMAERAAKTDVVLEIRQTH